MSDEYYAFGQALPSLDPSQLQFEESRRLLTACLRHKDFEVIELRRVESGSGNGEAPHVADALVVDCCDGAVPSRNPVGIKNRERLLLLHRPGNTGMPHEVRALRVDFPQTPHQNHVLMGKPRSLCLYFEPWSAVERSWTPARHLERILWWLRETSQATLHRSDQPLERMYFASRYQIVLPSKFHDQVKDNALMLRLRQASSRSDGTILRGEFVPKATLAGQDPIANLDVLVLGLPPIVSAAIEQYPETLGELHEHLMARGSELLNPLVSAIKQDFPAGQHQVNPLTQDTLLILHFPLQRTADGEPERLDVCAFIVEAPLVQLGLACGALAADPDGKAYVSFEAQLASFTGVAIAPSEAWRALLLEPIDVRFRFTPSNARKASGIAEDNVEFNGILAGVGALGSTMAELWSREGWGQWTYIDDDLLRAHNIVRHLGKDNHIGWQKVEAVANMTNLNWPEAPKAKAVPAKVTDFENPAVLEALSSASLIIDATTTLEAPRDLANRDESPRMASAFLTPSGQGAVLLLEDAERTIRLTTLEAQYYRAILNQAWGTKHLVGHLGSLWVGAGCRDLSVVMSNEVVQLHGAVLARQIRLLSAQPQAQLRVWSMDDSSGALSAHILPVEPINEQTRGEWRVIFDEGLARKLRALRAEALPKETGGVIVGYFDQRLKTLHVVDVLPPPADSDADTTGFTRGKEGLRERLETCAHLTANIVRYVGEWHSHPCYVSANPSTADAELLAHLAKEMAHEDLPALMLIVGEQDISISLGEAAS